MIAPKNKKEVKGNGYFNRCGTTILHEIKKE